MPYFERERGVKINYDDYGQGLPLVFPRGYSCNAWIWSYQAPLLAHKYICIVIEARGHERSSQPLRGYSIQDMAADDAAEIASLGIDRAILVENSMGGMRAMQICLDTPNLVTANVIISSATKLTQHVDPADLLRDLRTKYEEMTDGFVRQYFSKRTRQKPPEICTLPKNYLLDSFACPQLVACALVEHPDGVWNWDITTRPKENTQPTLIMVGEEDDATPVEANQFLAEQIPNTELQIITDVARMYQIKQPLTFNQMLEQFVAQLR
jgi:pimeloyl-ACP methyl ester carboxylesterase